MKKIVIFLLLFSFCFYLGFGQNNDLIQQIRTSGMVDILSFQTPNQGISNIVLTQQIGDLNKTRVNQQTFTGSSFSNQAYSIQQGNLNEITVGQIGNGNLLLGFQLGYLTSKFYQEQGTQFGFELESFTGTSFDNTSALPGKSGDNNKLAITQEGTNNSVMAIQQGSDNSISAGQKGTNNYLLFRQNGSNNLVTGYYQENTSGNLLFDTVIQEGEGLILNTSGVSKSKPNGNSFIQKGVNLTLEVNNQFTNTLGGIEVSQSGRDMKVIVDQSYFSFPTR